MKIGLAATRARVEAGGVEPTPLSRLAELESIAPTAELDPLRPGPHERRSARESIRALRDTAALALPGLVMVGALVGVAFLADALLGIPPLVAAVALGALGANLGAFPSCTDAGLRFAGKRLLRAGIVLLGLQLAVDEVLDLGVAPLAVVVVTVATTFVATRWLGRRLGLSDGLSTLCAAGFSICGASAIAAVDGVTDTDEDDVAVAIGLVTVFGTLAMVTLPALGGPLGLDAPEAFGAWVGASVHDVGQVVAASSAGGLVAVQTAVVVKLSRVVLLAPIVAGLAVTRRRRARGSAGSSGLANEAPWRRTPLVPLFVVGFLVAMTLRSTVDLGAGLLDTLNTVQGVLLAAALVGLGSGVRVDRLRRVGATPLVLGAASWVVIASCAYLGVTLTR